MNCLILNGNPEPSGFDDYLTCFQAEMIGRGATVERIDLRDLDFRFCTGCWSCWWATPGLCAHKDDMAGLYPKMVEADLVVWASPLILGTVSALLKKAQDRFIPLAHPYIKVVEGECHHRHRYQKNADIGLIVGPTADDDEEDLRIAREFFRRFSLNSRTAFRLFATTATPVKEAADEATAA